MIDTGDAALGQRLLLRGHLFDSNVINQILDLVETQKMLKCPSATGK